MTPRRIAIVPHTHWDREWYESFQVFRLKLVDMLDALLALLESDPAYPYFLLDGQMAVVDDYLEVRPEAEQRLRALAGGRPPQRWARGTSSWTSSSSSGETIIRNLQLGIARAAAFGGAMEVGYLPDMFGHIAQMPQILRQAGFEHAVVWRGVPSAVDHDRLLVGGARRIARSGPSTCSSATATAPPSPTTPRRWCGGSTASSRRVAAVPRIDDLLLHERHRPPAAPDRGWVGVVAEANEIQDDFDFDDHLAARLPGRRPDRRTADAGTASCARAPAPTC